MRKLIAGAMVLAAASANANTELKFGDVNYFLKTGQVNLAVDVHQATEQHKLGSNDTLETRGSIFSGTIGFGIADNLTLFYTQDYAHNNRTKDKSPPIQNSFLSNGFSNPGFGATLRLANQSQGSVNFDLGAIARINVWDSETGNIGPGAKDGNFAHGRSSLEVNAKLGQKWNEANEWQLAFGAIYFKDGETEIQATGKNEDIDSKFDLFARATYQYRPVNEFMTLLALQATRVGDGDIVRDSMVVDADSHIDLDFKFVAKYLVTENFIAKFNYDIGLISPDFDVKNSLGSSEVKRRHQNSFGLGVEFLF